MGEVTTYFFDSYAFFEIIEKNEQYLPYTVGVTIITTKLNLMELHYGLLRTYGTEKADFYYDRLVQFAIDFDDPAIKQANEFRASQRKRKLSYVDCLGYILARRLGVKFLTGDQQFKELAGVEFVK